MSIPAEKVATLASLRGQVAVRDSESAVVMGFHNSQGFELMQRGAKLLASSSLVPKDYQNNLPNCVIALNMASRMGADPLLVMQNLYLVHGKPGWSAQFLIATFNQCGRFTTMKYQWSGTEGKDDWSCRGYAKELDTGEIIKGPIVSIAMAKKEGWYAKNGSKWQTMPELMLMYRAAAFLIRTHAPELSMGLQTAEEQHDVYDARPDEHGRYSVNTEDLKPAVTTQEPQSTDDSKKSLNEAGDLATLEAAWQDIVKSYPASLEIPVEIEALYKFRKEGFVSKADAS